jgi:type I restriction enzyme S subunit
MKTFEPGCILFPRSGSVALNHRAILGIRACIVSHIGILRRFSDSINTSYLYRFLQTFDMTRLSKKTTGVDSIAFSDVGRIQVSVPPLPEQRRIVNLLDEADVLRRRRAQADRRTADLIPALFYKMFGDPVRNSNSLPTGELRDLANIITGNSPSRKIAEYYGNDIEWIKSDNINTPFHIVTRAEERLSVKGRLVGRAAPKGATLVTCIAGSPSCIGNAAMADREVAFNQQINAAIPKDGVDSKFLYALLLMIKPLVQAASTGGMKGIVSKSRFETVPVIIPPSKAQAEFGKRFDLAVVLLNQQDASRRRLDDLFQSMLYRAFQGEL